MKINKENKVFREEISQFKVLSFKGLKLISNIQTLNGLIIMHLFVMCRTNSCITSTL
jgi:hypothetical protein